MILGIIDRGWFGLVPLQAHLVICGFPRSGTTLLQLMAETAYPRARSFGRERSGLGAAQRHLPGRWPLIISKRPDDIFWVDEIREMYRARGTRTRPRFVVCVRDPRAVLTSIHNNEPGQYYVSVERWRAIYDHYRYVRTFDDIVVVEYGDLVLDLPKVQQDLEAATGLKPDRPFADYHNAVPGRFDVGALNGVRPLDPANLHKWKEPRHRARIQQLLRELPELPDRLIEMGYEPDAQWVAGYV